MCTVHALGCGACAQVWAVDGDVEAPRKRGLRAAPFADEALGPGCLSAVQQQSAPPAEGFQVIMLDGELGVEVVWKLEQHRSLSRTQRDPRPKQEGLGLGMGRWCGSWSSWVTG
jgi:hypothetical protein